jgi:hypothetical protein
VDLVVHEVVELQHVDVAHRHLAVEGVAGAAVEQRDLPRGIETRLHQHRRNVASRAPSNTGVPIGTPADEVGSELHHLLVVAGIQLGGIIVAVDVLELRTDARHVARQHALAAIVHVLEHRPDLLAEAARGPAKMGLEDLPDVHALKARRAD